MKTRRPTSSPSAPATARAAAAFSLIEVMAALALVGVLFLSVYSGLGTGFAVISVARENLRATQVMQEKLETLRLYSWDQINSNGFIPATFTAPYQPGAGTNNGLFYTGTMTITNFAGTENYATSMRTILLEVKWTSGTAQRVRTLQTAVARYGLQNYIY